MAIIICTCFYMETAALLPFCCALHFTSNVKCLQILVALVNIRPPLWSVVRVLGYRSGGPGSVPGTTRKQNVVGLERGAISLVSTTEELLDRKVAALV
jgi:hypothetical protein